MNGNSRYNEVRKETAICNLGMYLSTDLESTFP